MDTALLTAAGIDYDRGVKRFVGRANLFEKALTRFLQDTTFARIRIAYEAGNREQLLADAHEFKGMCGNIALTSLYERSASLVDLLRNGSDPCDTFMQLEAEYSRIYAAILAAKEAPV